MKLTGQITGVGKLGNIVVAQMAGQSIAREYREHVANPNTAGQVAQRAKLKLASQLSAALANSIVIPKKGMVSARNQFISKNMESIVFSGNAAQVSYENLQLTDGNIGLPMITAARDGANPITIALGAGAGVNVKRVVYSVYTKSTEGQLTLAASMVISDPGEGRAFTGKTPAISGDVVIYAYGMEDKDSAATAKFGSYAVESGTDIARLMANRSLSASDYRFTQTRGVTLFSNENSVESIPEGSHMVYITAGEGGTVSGTGFANGRKIVAEGESVSVTASANTNYTFHAWCTQSGGALNIVSTSATYTFTMGQSNVDLVATFTFHDPDDFGTGS